MTPFRMAAKLVILGGIALTLLICLFIINGLVQERKRRAVEVEFDIASSYAGEQQWAGPYLVLQVKESFKVREYNREKNVWFEAPREELRHVRIYPKTLALDAEIEVEERKRGIFKARVFQSALAGTGQFDVPPLQQLKVRADAEIELLSTQMQLVLADPRGFSTVPAFRLGEQSLDWKPGTDHPSLPGIHAEVDLGSLAEAWKQDFSVEAHVHGMGAFYLSPLAADNQLKITSPWPHPSFQGNFLPVSRSIGSEGFTATWSVNGLASNAQQSMKDQRSLASLQQLGVKLIDPVNPYPMTDRALKYGFLFIFLTFSAFLFYEITRELRIHPVQYGFVGFAQAMFFLLLLSLSEHVNFTLSYALGTTAVCGLLAFYLSSVLKSARRGLGFGACLLAVYAALYALLQSEDHALVAGSLFLFALLAGLMIATRNLDWYQLLRLQLPEGFGKDSQNKAQPSQPLRPEA